MIQPFTRRASSRCPALARGQHGRWLLQPFFESRRPRRRPRAPARHSMLTTCPLVASAAAPCPALSASDLLAHGQVAAGEGLQRSRLQTHRRWVESPGPCHCPSLLSPTPTGWSRRGRPRRGRQRHDHHARVDAGGGAGVGHRFKAVSRGHTIHLRLGHKRFDQ